MKRVRLLVLFYGGGGAARMKEVSIALRVGDAI
jgi:hypothetical protein